MRPKNAAPMQDYASNSKSDHPIHLSPTVDLIKIVRGIIVESINNFPNDLIFVNLPKKITVFDILKLHSAVNEAAVLTFWDPAIRRKCLVALQA